MLEKYIVCDACGPRSHSFVFSSVLYITPTCTSSMQELVCKEWNKNKKSPAFGTLGMSNIIIFCSLQNMWLLLLIDWDISTTILPKDTCSIPWIWLVFGLHKFSLQATIDHHGPSMYSGHDAASINCCEKTFYCNDRKITEFEMINTKNSSTAYVVMYTLISYWFSD